MATAKTDNRLDIKEVLRRMDAKDRNYYDSLSDEDKKKLSPFMLIRWGASVDGDPMLQHYYLAAANERLNKNFFDISAKDHKKLQWLLATTVSPDMGSMFHPWIAFNQKKQSKSGYSTELINYFSELYPEYDITDIDVLLSINSEETISQHLSDRGLDTKTIKALLKK